MGVYWIYSYGVDHHIESVGQPAHDNLETVAQTMSDAGDSSENAARTTRQARATLASASSSADAVAESIGDTADALDSVCFDIFCPNRLQGAIADLRGHESNAENLGTQLQRTANNLEANANDLERMSENFREMSEGVERISKQVEPATYASSYPVNWVISGLLGWVMFLHVLLVGIGVSLVGLSSRIGNQK